MKIPYLRGRDQNQELQSPNLPRLLLIGADKALSTIMEYFFQDMGYKCIVQFTFEGALKKISCFNPDIIILDFLLPTSNHSSLCDDIKRNPNTSKIPVILLSAYPSILSSPGKFCCDAFVEKPFGIHEIMRPIKQLMRIRTNSVLPNCQALAN